MKLFVIFTVDIEENGQMNIIWKKHMYLFKQHAFEEAKKTGSAAYVVELTQTHSWNLDQIKAEEF